MYLDSVTVPRSALLGRLGQGSLVFRHAMLWERSLLAALAVGTMRRQLTEVTDAAQAHDQQAEAASGPADPVRLGVDIAGRYLVGRLLVRDTVTKLAAGTLTPAQASLTADHAHKALQRLRRDLCDFGFHDHHNAGKKKGGRILPSHSIVTCLVRNCWIQRFFANILRLKRKRKLSIHTGLVLVVGAHDTLHQVVPHHVGIVEVAERQPVHIL